MAYLNKVFLLGNLGRDPEIKVTQNSKKFARFTIATTKRFRGAEVNMKEAFTAMFLGAVIWIPIFYKIFVG